MPLRVVLGSMCLATVAHAQPASETGPGVEAQVSTGSYGTEHGIARATEATDTGLGFALDGSLLDSDRYVTSAREIGARAQDVTGPRDVDVYVRAGDEHRELGLADGSTGVSLARYGARWQHSGDTAIVSVQAAGEVDHVDDRWSDDRQTAKLARNGGVASLRVPALHAFGLDHDLAIGTGFLLASGESDGGITRMNLAAARVRGNHRYLDAYLVDTIRLIRSFDIRAGAVIEQWSNLGGDDVALGLRNPMDGEVPEVSLLLVSPTFGVVERIDDHVALRARVTRSMRAPTVEELYRDGHAETAIGANPALRPEAVWTREAGPEISVGTLSARAAAFYATVDDAIGVIDGQRANAGPASISGAYADATWQVTPRWLGALAYSVQRPSAVLERARYPREVGAASLQYVPRRSTSVLAAVHVIDAAATVVDATAAHELRRGISAFVAVENLLDQRYRVAATDSAIAIDSLGAPRIVAVGLRLTSR